MAIKTLFRRGTRFPRLGVIRLGVKETNASGKEYPKEVNYFVLPPDLQESFEEAGLDPRPTSIEVSFPSDDVQQNFDTWFTRYDGPLLAAKCDGVEVLLIDKLGKETRQACGRKPEDSTKCSGCGATALGRLNVIVRHGKSMGVYQVLIGGVGRIESLLMELATYRDRPGLSRAWFNLIRIPQQQQIRKQDGSRMAREGYPVHLRFDYSPALILGDMIPTAALVGGRQQQALPQTTVIDTEADIVADATPDDDEATPTEKQAEVARQQADIPVDKPKGRRRVTHTAQVEHFASEQVVVGKHVEAPAAGSAVAEAALGPQEEKPQPVGPAAVSKDAEHWDVSLCISRAASWLGIQSADYIRYLDLVYGDHQAMDAMMLGDQQAALESAKRSAKVALQLKKAINMRISAAH